VRKRELEVLGEELLDVWALDVVGLLELNNLEDVNGSETGTVSGGHVLVESLNSICSGHLTVLLVHVVSSGAGVVSNPDTEVLDLERALLVDHVQADDLSVRLLDLAELHQEVPEAGLCNNSVWCKDTHAVELWGWVSLRRQVAPDDLVLCKTTCRRFR